MRENCLYFFIRQRFANSLNAETLHFKVEDDITSYFWLTHTADVPLESIYHFDLDTPRIPGVIEEVNKTVKLNYHLIGMAEVPLDTKKESMVYVIKDLLP